MWSLAVLGVFAILGATNALPFKKHHEGRIVGGDYVSIQDFPYQVVLLTSRKQSACGGSILNENYILTAGHCVEHVTFGYVRAGSNITYRGGSLHRITEIKQHEGYFEMERGVMNDIAVMKVDPPFIFDSTTKPIEIYEDENRDVQVGDVATISGYGSWGSEFDYTDENLMAVSVPIVNRADCDYIYKGIQFEPIKKDRICAGYIKGGKDSCQGDSGGPLVINGKQAGVVSYGDGCGVPNVPGIYSNVPYFAKWIKDNTSPEVKC